MGHHARMVLRIDPRLSLVWRSPDTLQVGADRPNAVLAGLTFAEERLVAALRLGTTRTALGVLAGACGAPETLVDDLLARLGDAVQDGPASSAPIRVAVECDRPDALAGVTRIL